MDLTIQIFEWLKFKNLIYNVVDCNVLDKSTQDFLGNLYGGSQNQLDTELVNIQQNGLMIVYFRKCEVHAGQANCLQGKHNFDDV